MKLFSLIKLKYDEFESAIRGYLSDALGRVGVSFSNSSVFGQIINVVSASVQNILSYIEDGITEQNKLTAQRRRSIYNLAAISGYNPSMGTATTGVLCISFKPNNLNSLNVILPNKTKLTCLQNGLTYNIILPQEAIILSPARDNSSKYITIVEGRFETQQFTVGGGQLYTQNVRFSGDADIDYLEVYVNGELWERRESLYDLDPEGLQYVAKTSLKTGFDLIFGDSQNGKALRDGDTIKVSYLLHSGEYGNLNPNEEIKFEFATDLKDISGASINGNNVFALNLFNRDNINCGTFSESISRVREMIGYNSRSLVLADPKNYKQFFNRFSFVGYNRTWSERGSLIINSLIIKNYKANLEEGKDYFNLHEDDFKLSKMQKDSIINSINKSGQQLAGTVINIFDPEIVKYAAYIYLKLKDTEYDADYIREKVRNLVGEFFMNIQSDIFIPKSDIVKLIKDNIDVVDGVDVYFISQLNEEAIMNKSYINKVYKYDLVDGTYKIHNEKIYVNPEENPNVGLDAHGNILLDNTDQFPALLGGWSFVSQPDQSTTHIDDPLFIIFE